MEKVTEEEKEHLEAGCEFCGKPISKCAPEFGMDCEDDCARKLYEDKFGSINHDASDKKEDLLRMFDDMNKIVPKGGDFLKDIISNWGK